MFNTATLLIVLVNIRWYMREVSYEIGQMQVGFKMILKINPFMMHKMQLHFS